VKKGFNIGVNSDIVTRFTTPGEPQHLYIWCPKFHNQLISISNDFGKAFDDGKEIRIIFCDISKAFDRVCHKGLLYKLKSSGLDDTVLKWFESYLSNTRQQVAFCYEDIFQQEAMNILKNTPFHNVTNR
jgi:ABC-type branched-subunit amino acid transport system substrate-binding protein